MSGASNDNLNPELAQKLQKALTAGQDELFQIIQSSTPAVVRASLKNPSLHEDHLMALLKRPNLPEELLKVVYHLKLTEASHRLKVALAKNPATPGPILQSVLPHLHLFELVDICFLPGGTPDQKVAAERAIIKRLPTTPLGNKITLARRGTATIVDELLKEGSSQLMAPILSNPRLKEVSIFQFLNGSKATPETISCIARHGRWKHRPNLHLAILKNRKTPLIWFTVLLPKLKTSDINAILASRRLNPAQKKAVGNELQRRGMKGRRQELGTRN